MSVGMPRLLATVLCFLPAPARAIDCTKAGSVVDRAICASPSAREADAAMAKAYFVLLRSISDRAFKDALIASQRAWLKARMAQDTESYRDVEGGLAGVLERQSLQRRALLERRGGAEPTALSRMRRQRELLARHPGTYSGFAASCLFEPPPWNGGLYDCMPDIRLHRNDRLCSRATSWATGRVTNVWTVAQVGMRDT